MNNRTLTKLQHHINEARYHEGEATAWLEWNHTILTTEEECESARRAAEVQKLANHEWMNAVVHLLRAFA